MPAVTNNNAKARWWILTIPAHDFIRYLPKGISYIRGQLECGHDSGYVHWQLVCHSDGQCRLSAIKKIFGSTCHAEPTKSDAALEYVWKEDTAVAGTRFELGDQPFNPSSEKDWARVYSLARSGDLENPAIPPSVRIRSYHSLKGIAKDYARPVVRGPQTVNVFWGKTGSGKSYRAFQEAGEMFYLKDPHTKWWDGYRGEENIIIDEFRGKCEIGNLLKWVDWTPCLAETKGSQVPLRSKKWWIMSNLDPREWYKDLDPESLDAFIRRLGTITHFTEAYGGIANAEQ